MDITPLIPQGAQIIQSYADGRFRVSNVVYDGGVIVFTDHAVSWPVAGAIGALSVADFKALIDQSDELDVVLVGCGKVMPVMPFALRSALKAAGISVEFMDTGAACRTYNVLMAEGRRVAAALMPV